jgi:hypothetical protein
MAEHEGRRVVVTTGSCGIGRRVADCFAVEAVHLDSVRLSDFVGEWPGGPGVAI